MHPAPILVVTGLALAILAASSAPTSETCTAVVGDMQFCAVLERVPAAGDHVELTLIAKNLGPRTIAAISLAKVPEAQRGSFVDLWVAGQRLQEGPAELRPEYVVELPQGATIRATVRTSYVAHAGHNELRVSVPYWWPDESYFTEKETHMFYRQAWKAPKVLPLIGPLEFDAK